MGLRPRGQLPSRAGDAHRTSLGTLLRIVLALSLAGCVSSVPAPILGGGPGRPGDPRVFDDAVRGAQSAGYQPQRLDPEAGSFSVSARSDRTGRTRFQVQCFADGYVSVVPEGSRVSHSDGEMRLPPRLRSEYGRISAAIADAIEVRP